MTRAQSQAGGNGEPPPPEGPLLVSACLLGHACRYDGGHCRRDRIVDFCRGREIVPVCPETMGGLPRPRPPAEIKGGGGADVLNGTAKVIDRDGRDVTADFIRGAQEALMLARDVGARAAVLKARSPSCGIRCVYDGTFSRRTVSGAGVAAALLAQDGIRLWDEEDVEGGEAPSGMRILNWTPQ